VDGDCGIIKSAMDLHHLADSWLSDSCRSLRFSDPALCFFFSMLVGGNIPEIKNTPHREK